MSVEWDEAQRSAARQWRRVADEIGRRDPLTIVADLNETSALCEMACCEAGARAERCSYCVVFAGARQCAEARLDITTLLLAGEVDRAREATLAIVERIAAAAPPSLL